MAKGSTLSIRLDSVELRDVAHTAASWKGLTLSKYVHLAIESLVEEYERIQAELRNNEEVSDSRNYSNEGASSSR